MPHRPARSRVRVAARPRPDFTAPLAAAAVALLAALLLLAAPARADLPDGVAIGDLEVETGMADIEGSDAGVFWAELEDDLRKAIEDRVGAVDTEGGAHVRVRIDGVALSNAYDMMQTGNVPFLDGRVTVIGPTMSDSRQLRISAAEDAEGNVPDGEDAKYTQLLQGFADGVAEVLE